MGEAKDGGGSGRDECGVGPVGNEQVALICRWKEVKRSLVLQRTLPADTVQLAGAGR